MINVLKMSQIIGKRTEIPVAYPAMLTDGKTGFEMALGTLYELLIVDLSFLELAG
jgi:hypothetical protein